MIPTVEDIIDEINKVQIHEGRKLMLYEMRPIMEKHIAKVERPQEVRRMNDDLISRSDLYRKIKTECNPYGKPTIDFESGKRVLDIIDNAPAVSDRYDEGYSQGYIDGSTGADWKGGAE